MFSNVIIFPKPSLHVPRNRWLTALPLSQLLTDTPHLVQVISGPIIPEFGDAHEGFSVRMTPRSVLSCAFLECLHHSETVRLVDAGFHTSMIARLSPTLWHVLAFVCVSMCFPKLQITGDAVVAGHLKVNLMVFFLNVHPQLTR